MADIFRICILHTSGLWPGPHAWPSTRLVR